MSTSAIVSHGLKIDNLDRRIGRLVPEVEDFRIFGMKEALQRTIIDVESSVVATTITENKLQQIENVLYAREPLLRERNSILDSIFKYYNPFYRKKLKKINAELDELELKIYYLESSIEQIESDIDKAIERTNKSLEFVRGSSLSKNVLNRK